MPSSLALDIFDRLLSQVDVVEAAAGRAEADGYVGSAPVLRRSGFVLAVAALDSYFHERAVPLLATHARSSTAAATQVANYVKSVGAADVAGAAGESHVRLQLSFRTLVAPHSIDGLLSAADIDANAAWLAVAFGLQSRPDRLRRLVELLYDRRNQIAHEADWDVGRLDFRPMEQAHLADCVRHVREIVDGFDAYL